MIKEYKLRQLAKLVETSWNEWNVMYDGELIGTVEKRGAGNYRAVTATGRFIGSGSSKGEAKFFIAWDFVGTENILFKGEEA